MILPAPPSPGSTFLVLIRSTAPEASLWEPSDLGAFRGGILLLHRGLDTMFRRYRPIVDLVERDLDWIFLAVRGVGDPREVVHMTSNMGETLRTSSRFRMFGWIVDHEELGNGGFSGARRRLLARFRRRRRQDPPSHVPGAEETGNVAERPPGAEPPVTARSGSPGIVRLPAGVRRRLGLEGKVAALETWAPSAARGMGFTTTLEKLTSAPRAGVLDGRMGVIALRIVHRAGLRRRVIASHPGGPMAGTMAWTAAEQALWRDLLETLLFAMRLARAEWTAPDDSFRLEVFPLGSRGLVLMVPAWCAWRTAGLLLERAASRKTAAGPPPCTAGLVLCDHHAPLRPIVELAGQLATVAGRGLGQGRCACRVLAATSPAGVPEDAPRTQPGPAPGPVVAGDAMIRAQDALRRLLQAKPSANRQLLEAAHGDSVPALENVLGEELAHAPETRAALEACFGPVSGSTFWRHLHHLGPYLAACTPPPGP